MLYPEENNPLPLSVSELNKQIRLWLEGDFGQVQVVGEISNLAKPSSGHLYFTLKDANAQLRCVHFKYQHNAFSRQLQEGQQILATGQLSLYEARGDFQLIVSQVAPCGMGRLYQQFEALKKSLEARGLFDPALKKPLPIFPAYIGLITSPSGAAVHDVLTTLKRRYPLATVIFYPSEVQGKEAHKQLLSALQQAYQEPRIDVLILARGGGSIEDLWAFNDEALALWIRQSPFPIVTGIGHETDFTIADFVADKRAATPTAAAETVSPSLEDYKLLLTRLREALCLTLRRRLQHHAQQLQIQLGKLQSPKQLLMRHIQTLDYLEQHLWQQMRYMLQRRDNQLQLQQHTLLQHHPKNRLLNAQHQLALLKQALQQPIQNLLQQKTQALRTLMATLHAVSPLATLDRGYAIALHHDKALMDSDAVAIGDTIQLQLAKGRLTCEVMERSVLEATL